MANLSLTTRDVARELARRYSTMTHEELDMLEEILVPRKYPKGARILDEGEVVVDLAKLEERRRKRKEYDKQYYQLHKAKMAEKRKIAYKRKKAGKFI